MFVIDEQRSCNALYILDQTVMDDSSGYLVFILWAHLFFISRFNNFSGVKFFAVTNLFCDSFFSCEQIISFIYYFAKICKYCAFSRRPVLRIHRQHILCAASISGGALHREKLCRLTLIEYVCRLSCVCVECRVLGNSGY